MIVQAPKPFPVKEQPNFICYAPVNRTAGTVSSVESMKGRIFETSLGDIQNDPKFYSVLASFKVEEVKEKVAYTSFYGMRFSNDKLKGLMKKWRSTITATVDVKTADSYVLRVFVLTFTKKRQLQVRKTTYAHATQVKKITKKMRDSITEAAKKQDITEFCGQLQHGALASTLEKECSPIFPVCDTCIYKVKVVKTPKFEQSKLYD